jgi:2-keto-3-deoxy-L-rhamnonate aldolase RhmA
MFTPLELLNLYLSDGKSTGPKESRLYQKFNSELTWDAILNEGYQQDLAPMLYYIITKTNTLSAMRYAPSSSPDALCAMPHAPCQVSDEIKDKLKALYNQYLVQSMIQFNELDKILNAFEKEGIDVIQLKGAWIAKKILP